jgi:ribosome-associated heat shock protein Hsp15
LKKVLIIKQRTQAKRACESGFVTLDGRKVKPSTNIEEGQVVRVQFPKKCLEILVTGIPSGNVSRSQCKEYYRILKEDRVEENINDF